MQLSPLGLKECQWPWKKCFPLKLPIDGGKNGLSVAGIFASKILQQVDKKIEAQNINVI